jgi:hypothetical protein
MDSLFFFKFFKFLRLNINSKFYVNLDNQISRLVSWNLRYHREKIWHKIAPGSLFFVTIKN